jgi:hypothetical protein
MNLIQINERLKDLPMQVIQQYANGMNPEIPPYLALGELQRRELSAKQMANQGGASGPQQSVKEQVEQKAGLMELQKMQQQQMAQQQIQPRGPMPAPAGIPQPEAQPEAMMARGGLAGVPMRRDMFEYAGGGIIAFADGGPPTMNERAAKQMEEKGSIYDKYFGLPKKERERRRLEDRLKAESRDDYAGQGLEMSPEYDNKPSGSGEYLDYLKREQKAYDVQKERQLEKFLTENIDTQAAQEKVLKKDLQSEVDSLARRYPAPPPRNPNITQETMDRVGPMTAPKYKDPRIVNSGLPAAAPPPSNRAPNNPGGGANQTGAGLQAAAQASNNPYIKKLEDLTNKPLVQPTEEDTLTSVGKLTPQALQQAAMDKRYADQRSRADKERSAYENSRPSGLDELIRVLGQSGQYKGLSGMAPAYTAMQRQNRAEDLAMEQRQNSLMTAIEGREYDSGKELFSANTTAFNNAKKLFGEESAAQIRGVADLAQVTQSQINSALDRLTDIEMKRLDRVAKAEELKANGAGEARKVKFLALKAQARKLAEEGKPKEAADAEAQAADILTLSAGTAGVGAARNAIMQRRATMVELQEIIKNEGAFYTDEEVAEAARRYKTLAMQNAQAEGEEGGGGNGPKIGDVQQGYRFKGGNPADQSNWEKVK